MELVMQEACGAVHGIVMQEVDGAEAGSQYRCRLSLQKLKKRYVH